MSPKARIFWPLVLVLVLTDCSSKDLAVDHLSEGQVPHSVLDFFIRFTLVYNPGTAFGFDLRPYIGEWRAPS